MFFLNLKHSFRTLLRNKVYFIINLLGLGISTAFILLVAIYVVYAMRMDRYSEKVKRSFRIEANSPWDKPDTAHKKGFFDLLTGSNNQKFDIITPVILAEDIKRSFSEIEQTCRIRNIYEPVIKVDNKKFKEQGKSVAFVDENFFEFFDLPLITTNKKAAFANKNSVVLTERLAEKYFGNNNPIGRTISMSDDNTFIVSAIAKNFPTNSSMQFDLLFPVDGSSSYDFQRKQGTNTASYLTIVQFKPGADISLFQKKLALFGEKYFESAIEITKKYNPEIKDFRMNLSIRRFPDSHFNASSNWFYLTDLKSLYQLISLALIALAIACLNYVLLSLSRISSRSHEAGVRKTIGATWRHITNLFITETGILVSASVISAFLIAFFTLPYFNSLTKLNISSLEFFHWQFLLVALGLIIVLTLIAGIYPAVKLSGISPLSILSKFGTYRLNPSLSKVFIAFQYIACIVLIVFSVVIAQQIRFMNNKDLGFEKEQMLIIDNPYWMGMDRSKTMLLRDRLQSFARSQPEIAGVTATDFRFARWHNMNGHIINGKQIGIIEMKVDYDYFELTKIPILEGRSFSRDFKTDTSKLTISEKNLDSLSSKTYRNLIVNETLYNLLGRPALNEVVRSLGGIIIGVCKDYYFEGFEHKIEPAYHTCKPDWIGTFWFKINRNQNVGSVVKKLKAKFIELTNGEDFNYYFMDQDVKQVFESHTRWLKIISFASWMAIFIASLGLFGLSAIIAVNRTKEIGIRKVLGATLTQLFFTLNKQILSIVALSIIIAIPIAIYISNSWLENFAYRISLSWLFFLVAAIIGMLCALIAISYHALKVANTNPVISLRSE